MPTTARLLAAAAVLTGLVVPATAHAGQYAYTADRYNASIVAYRQLPGGALTKIGSPFPAGDGPVAVAVSPDARSLYAANANSHTVSAYDVQADGTLVVKTPDRFATVAAPNDLVVSADGTRLYVLEGAAHRIEWFTIDAEGDAGDPHALDVPGATRMVMSPDGTSLYLLDGAAGTLTHVRATGDGLSVGATVAVGPGLTDVAIRNDGTQVFATGAVYGGRTPETSLYVLDRAADGTLTSRDVRSDAAAGLGAALVVDPGDDWLRTANGSLGSWPIGAGGELGAPAVMTDTRGEYLGRSLFESADGDTLYAQTDTTVVDQFDLGPDDQPAWKTPVSVAMPSDASRFAMTPQADLAVTQALPAAAVAAGSEFTYKIVVSNVQGTPATQVAIRSAMADDLTLLSASTPDGTCAASTDVECRVASLAQGHSATVTVRARAARTGSIYVGANVGALQPDPAVGDNTSLAGVGVEPLPGAVTAPASDVTATSSMLNAVVAPARTDSRVRFELGTTDGYGTTTADVSAGDGTDGRVVSATVHGLQPATTYHYRVVVENGEGALVTGADRTFTTAPAAQQPQAPAGPTGQDGAGEQTDHSAPGMSAIKLSATRLSLRLSEAGEVRATIARARAKRVRVAGKPRTVTAWVTVRHATIRAAKVGAAAARIVRLSAGPYRVTLRATDAAGNRSAAMVVTRTLR